MKISFENFGKAGRGDIEIKDLTIICGPNGSGKTYASYAIYGCLSNFSDFLNFRIDDNILRDLAVGNPVEIDLEEIMHNMDAIVADAGDAFLFNLDEFFNAPQGFFSHASFKFKLDKGEVNVPRTFSTTVSVSKSSRIDVELAEGTSRLQLIYSGEKSDRFPRQLFRRFLSRVISKCLLGDKVPEPFVVTSERTGVALFYKELDINRNAILSQLSSTDRIDPVKIIQAMQSRYALPIQHNIDVIRDYGNLSKSKSFLRSDKVAYSSVLDALNELLGGTFRDSNNQLTYMPKKERSKPRVAIPLYIASSSIKSLFLVDMYINHLAKKNGILIIDEPELNLHPDNQVRMARLIARLVNAGVKVLVTTHSDYFVREINNLITIDGMKDGRTEIMQKYGYSESDLLQVGKVAAYCSVPGKGIVDMGTTSSGINTAIFDDIIAAENFKAQDIFSVIEK